MDRLTKNNAIDHKKRRHYGTLYSDTQVRTSIERKYTRMYTMKKYSKTLTETQEHQYSRPELRQTKTLRMTPEADTEADKKKTKNMKLALNKTE